LPNVFHNRRFGFLIARAAVLLSIVVLVCVPAITRVGQRLETASHTPSFAKNIDCPPKKVTVAPVPVASLTPLATFEAVRIAAPTPSADALRPRSPFLVVPRPLRAPPTAPLA
jgi:hypothetical protein